MGVVCHGADEGCILEAINPRLAAAEFQKGNTPAAKPSDRVPRRRGVMHQQGRQPEARRRQVPEGQPFCSSVQPSEPRLVAEGEDHRAYPDVPAFWTAQPGNGSTDTGQVLHPDVLTYNVALSVHLK